MTRQVVRNDPELGQVRWCPNCGEEWPDDPLFWSYLTDRKTPMCKACRADDRSGRAVLLAAGPRDRPAPTGRSNQCRWPSCPVILPADGRTHCHYHRRMLP